MRAVFHLLCHLVYFCCFFFSPHESIHEYILVLVHFVVRFSDDDDGFFGGAPGGWGFHATCMAIGVFVLAEGHSPSPEREWLKLQEDVKTFLYA